MFIRFKVGNFLSFKDETEFSMVAEPLIDKKESHCFPIDIENISLLKSAAIYGPNGSGKSNLIKAIEFMAFFVRNSAKESQAEEEIPVTHFKLSTLTEGQPTFFEIELLVHKVKYRYGFKVDRVKVHSEWLFMTKKFKEYNLFTRDKSSFSVDARFNEGHDIEGKTRANALFLSAVAQWNGKISVSIIEVFKQILFFNDAVELRNFSYTTNLLEDYKYKKAILNFLKSADLGITDLKTEPFDKEDFFKSLTRSSRSPFINSFHFPDSKTIKTGHIRYDHNNVPDQNIYLDLASEESLGTQKIFSLAGPIIDSLWTGKVLVIDEFSSRMHPNLIKYIVKRFNSSSDNFNKMNAQLVFASHNYGIMERELFRRDQIYFTRKNKQGATEITTLFKEKVRHDTSFRSQYFLKGFGAKPNLPEDDDKGEQLDLF